MKRQRSVAIESFQEEWQCPIKFEAMSDPVITKDGHSYERKDIQQWLSKSKTSPKTGLELSSVELIPNIALKNVINKYQTEMKYDMQRVITENFELIEKMQKYEQAARQMIKQRTKLQNEVKQAKQKCIETLNNSSTISQAYLKNKKQIQALKSQNQLLKGELSKIKQQAVKIKEQGKQHELRKLQNDRIKRELQQLKVQNKKLKDEGQARLKKMQLVSKIFTTNETTRAQNESFKRQIIELKIKNQNLSKFQSQNIKLVNKLTVSDQSIKSMKILVEKLNKDLDQKKTIQQSLTLQLSAKQRVMNQLKAQKNQLEREIKQLRSQVENLKNPPTEVKKTGSFSNTQIIKMKPQPVIQNIVNQKPHSHALFNQLIQNKKNIIKAEEKSSTNKQSIQKYKPLPSKKQQYEAPKMWRPQQQNQATQIKKNASAPMSEISKNLNQLENKLGETSNTLQKIISSQNDFMKNLQKTSESLNSFSSSFLKPVPLTDRSANNQSLSSSNLFQSLIRQQPKKQPQNVQKRSTIFNHTSNFRQYLMENPVLYEEQSQTLDHSDHKINVQEFLKYNWSHIKTLKLNGSQIDDYGFYLLANEGSSFPNLQTLILHNNQIKNIPTRSLERFKNLKGIYFSLKGKFANPLNQQSKMYLSDFSVKNQHINVCYKAQDSECSIQ